MNNNDINRAEPLKGKARERDAAYDGLLSLLKGLQGKTSEAELIGSLRQLVDEAISALSSNTVGIMLNLSRNFVGEDYIYAHSLNVCLLAILLGMKKEFDKRRLRDMALLALTHARKDIGIPEHFTHLAESDKEMEEIVRLSDIYDTLTHPPEYRHQMTTSDTLVSIIDARGFFNPELVRILMNELSFYPEGSLVELNTKQRGTVIRTNKEQPLRPVVEVISGDKKVTIDLSKELLVHIVRTIE